MSPSLQNWVPQHALSRFAGFLANSKRPWLKNYLIRYFINRYPVNLSEAVVSDPFAYASYNDFFTRALKPEVRPISEGVDDFVSPADGCISQIGRIREGELIQAKGHHFSVADLLGEGVDGSFRNGSFVTLYLAPQDYHRVHMPIDGHLKRMVYVPGKLFSVNTRTAEETPNLFARNERVIAFFDTEFGNMAMVLVGAMIVGSIETVWAGTVAPAATASKDKGKIEVRDYEHPIFLKRGEEMGRFKLGSTVIVLMEADRVQWDAGLEAASAVKMGQKVGKMEK